MQIVIPAAGEGSRFKEAGYTLPKPLIDVCGTPMLQRVVDNFNDIPGNVILIVRDEDKTAIMEHVSANVMFALKRKTEGAACTVLEIVHELNLEDELIIANCDQLVLMPMQEFIHFARKWHACIMTFNSTNPHHSYVKASNGLVTEVAEKKVISDNAVVGVYYWKRASDFVQYANEMIRKNDRVKGEFYITPVFKYALKAGLMVAPYEIDVHKKHMLGTPYELEIFLEKVKSGEVDL